MLEKNGFGLVAVRPVATEPGDAPMAIYRLPGHAPETRIVLRARQAGEADDPIVDHPGQPGDYVHPDGTVWTWEERWRIVSGVHLRPTTSPSDTRASRPGDGPGNHYLT